MRLGTCIMIRMEEMKVTFRFGNLGFPAEGLNVLPLLAGHALPEKFS